MRMKDRRLQGWKFVESYLHRRWTVRVSAFKRGDRKLRFARKFSTHNGTGTSHINSFIIVPVDCHRFLRGIYRHYCARASSHVANRRPLVRKPTLPQRVAATYTCEGRNVRHPQRHARRHVFHAQPRCAFVPACLGHSHAQCGRLLQRLQTVPLTNRPGTGAVKSPPSCVDSLITPCIPRCCCIRKQPLPSLPSDIQQRHPRRCTLSRREFVPALHGKIEYTDGQLSVEAGRPPNMDALVVAICAGPENTPRLPRCFRHSQVLTTTRGCRRATRTSREGGMPAEPSALRFAAGSTQKLELAPPRAPHLFIAPAGEFDVAAVSGGH